MSLFLKKKVISTAIKKNRIMAPSATDKEWSPSPPGGIVVFGGITIIKSFIAPIGISLNLSGIALKVINSIYQ